MIQGIRVGDISIDCINAVQLCDFYAELLGWKSCIMYDCPAICSETGLTLLFMEADFAYEKPIWPEELGAQQKQMHFNFQVDNLMDAVQQAISMGAHKAECQFGGSHFVTMIDPEGHPFCLCAK